MTSNKQDLKSFKVMGFDTMGTLLDEKSGIITAFEPTRKHLNDSIPGEDLYEAFEKFLKQHMKSQGPQVSYRKIMADAHREATEELSKGAYSPPEAESLAFSDGLKSWPAFPDTVAAMQTLAKRSKLVLLSNMDTETLSYIAEKGELRDVPIAAVIGRDKSGGFKPDHRVNQALVDAAKTEFGVEKEHVLLVAQGVESDHVPAREMGISSAWVDRYGRGRESMEKTGARPGWVVSKLSELADELNR
ncbi:hypothetical protein ANO11243_045220 [Dothideomycetidae sp. 11243]|nr:hypothetical protein ANO11243_045220 [fungal sp. No.11243]